MFIEFNVNISSLSLNSLVVDDHEIASQNLIRFCRDIQLDKGLERALIPDHVISICYIMHPEEITKKWKGGNTGAEEEEEKE